MVKLITYLLVFFTVTGAFAATPENFISSLPAQVKALEKESQPLDGVRDSSSPIIFARSELTIAVSEQVEIKDEEAEARKEDLPWQKQEEPKEKKFKSEKRVLRFTVEVKDSNTFIKDEEAYIDMGAYPAKSGLLIVFPKLGKHGFSLVNLNSAADFIFMDKQGRITEFYPGVVPGALEEMQSSKPSYAILVLHAGVIEAGRIKAGDIVIHKALEMPPNMVEMSGKTAPKKAGAASGSSPVIFNSKGK